MQSPTRNCGLRYTQCFCQFGLTTKIIYCIFCKHTHLQVLTFVWKLQLNIR
nr:MAG TPA: hypothetical protein [Caudoviricetes sp.]